ncbi:MAG: hypothetical protein D6B25_14325 [Desulfobulbaceae bacterium]|nr:MAG: hypothetical protein D6B25_14325 [Desulfobulbaceae bacterium]
MKCFILPGMGANTLMYPQQNYQHLSDVTFINWPKYSGEASLSQVAESIINLHGINEEDIIGGSSLGGMVSIEIAKRANCRKVILIGSATAPDFINPLLQKLSNFAHLTPIKLVQIFTGKVNLYTHSELFSMFEGAEENFIKAMCKALFKWEGLGSYNGAVAHIHGESDLVIFPPDDDVEIIPKGGHLISMSHADIVAKFISDALA